MFAKLKYTLPLLLLCLMMAGICFVQTGQMDVVGGNSSQHPTATHPVGSEECMFSQPTPPDTGQTGRYFGHSLFAPEIAGGVLALHPDLKAFVRTIPVSGYGCCDCSSAMENSVNKIAEVHPGGVDYYIYTLGKIRI